MVLFEPLPRGLFNRRQLFLAAQAATFPNNFVICVGSPAVTAIQNAANYYGLSLESFSSFSAWESRPMRAISTVQDPPRLKVTTCGSPRRNKRHPLVGPRPRTKRAPGQVVPEDLPLRPDREWSPRA